jgi:hypothetical protein
MKTFIKNKKSFALILAVFVLLAFSVTGMTAISLLSRRTAIYLGVLDNQKAMYLAESARDFFLEYVIPFENDLTTGNPNIIKTLGDTNSRFTIFYGTRTARTASVTLSGNVARGSSVDFTRDISLDITEDVTQNQNIVANLKKYSAFLGGTNTKYISSLCYRWSTNFIFCTARFSCQFFGNTYAQSALALASAGQGYQVVWGSSSAPKNLYTQDSLNLTGIYDSDLYGVFGNAYSGGSITDPALAVYGTKYPGCTCSSNPTECCWPTKAPTDTSYYNKIITKSTGGISTLTINTTNAADPYRNGLNYRNIYVVGNVTITSSSSYPLNGPGNIIAGGTITINSGSYIRDRIGLISNQVMTVNGTCYIGGVLSGSYISGQGVNIYSNNDVSITGTSRLKAFILAPSGGAIDNQVTLFQNSGTPSSYAQLQGLIYTESLSSVNGYIYGNVYTDNIETNTISMIHVFDNIPGVGSTESFRPIQIRGLYNPGMSFEYQ